jgi:hypothetical protein
VVSFGWFLYTHELPLAGLCYDDFEFGRRWTLLLNLCLLLRRMQLAMKVYALAYEAGTDPEH